jgi:hypothetical protein
MKQNPNAVAAKAVLTLAVGKELYVRMAANLARSFRWWHRDSGIRFFLATDRPELVPEDLRDIGIVELQPGELGHGFSPKLHLDRLAPAQETLFLDADCLCVANLEPIFEKFRGCEVSVVGREEVDGDLFGDIAARCRAVGATWTPRFCGGLYYLKKGAVCERVFRTARELETRYDELGLSRLRGVPNEEPLIGLAMALAGQHPVPEDGSIKAEPMFFSGPVEIDVFAGRARLFDIPARPKPYPEWQIPAESRPAIVHFNSYFAEHPPYTTEALRLEKALRQGWPVLGATIYARLTCSFPYWIMEQIRKQLRPAYHALFGPRGVKDDNRV